MSMTLPLIVAEVIAGALRQIGAEPNLPLRPDEAPAVAEAVETRLQKDPRFQEVAAEVEHLTNQEPWYRSRVTWGALITLVASVGSAFGLTLGAAEVEAAATVVTAAGALFGAILTLYGRWIARRPIGY